MPQTLLNEWQADNLDLIKSLSADTLQSLQLTIEQSGDIDWGALQPLLEERLEVSSSRAELIARDQTLKLNANVTEWRQTEAGVERYIWTTSNDERVREGHAELDGEEFSWDDPPDTGDGETNHPGEDYQCRCIAFPVIPELDDEEPEDVPEEDDAPEPDELTTAAPDDDTELPEADTELPDDDTDTPDKGSSLPDDAELKAAKQAEALEKFFAKQAAKEAAREAAEVAEAERVAGSGVDPYVDFVPFKAPDVPIQPREDLRVQAPTFTALEQVEMPIVEAPRDAIDESYKDAIANLSDDEKTGIKRFTHKWDSFIRQYNREQPIVDDAGVPISPEDQALTAQYAAAIERAFDKARPEPGVTYRGLSGIPANVIEQMTNAREVIFDATTSTSRETNTAVDFAATSSSKDHSVLYRIKQRTGIPISPISQYQDEHETLMRAGTRFRVVDRKRAKFSREYAEETDSREVLILDIEEI